MAKNMVLVKGPEDVLSNFFPCDFKFGEVSFTSVEHCYQFHKALYHNLPELAEEIKNSEDAPAAKKISKSINSVESWHQQKYNFMKRLVGLKFQQVQFFRDFLMTTGTRPLVHNVQDEFWGTGKQNNGSNYFGKILMELREENAVMKIGVFGSSYVKRLGDFCNGDFKVPFTVKCFGKGGMRVTNLPREKVEQIFDFRPHSVFIQLGGNDISPTTNPSEIFNHLCTFIESLKDNGVQQVFIGEIFTRGNFSKSPGVDKKLFDSVRKLVNRKIEKKYGKALVRFNNIKFPNDYLEDQVHFNTSGLKKYYAKLRRLFFSVRRQ